MKSHIIAGTLLCAGVMFFSQDANVILSPGFKRRVEKGENRRETSESLLKTEKARKDCPEEHIYHNRQPNHIATLTDPFSDTIQVTVDPEVNPQKKAEFEKKPIIIIIQSSDRKWEYCKKVSDTLITDEILYESKVTDIPAGSYYVWIGDIEKGEYFKYTVEVTEEK